MMARGKFNGVIQYGLPTDADRKCYFFENISYDLYLSKLIENSPRISAFAWSRKPVDSSVLEESLDVIKNE
jgi:hypothetical protein